MLNIDRIKDTDVPFIRRAVKDNDRKALKEYAITNKVFTGCCINKANLPLLFVTYLNYYDTLQASKKENQQQDSERL